MGQGWPLKLISDNFRIIADTFVKLRDAVDQGNMKNF